MQDPHTGAGRLNPFPAGLTCREHWLDLSKGAVVMGILNITPDSFYDGGKYLRESRALQHAEKMLAEGASIIDVGGASSRPRGSVYGAGAEPVTEKCEKERIVPVIKAIRSTFPEVIVSADTYSPEVVLAALDAGVHMINDISGLQSGTASAEYAGQAGVAYVVMHSVRQQGHLVHATAYADVVDEVQNMLGESAGRARAAGVKSIVIDPGFGFGKVHADNLRLLNRLDVLTKLGYPVLAGISRKSTVGQVLSRDDTPLPVQDRLFGSLGMAAAAVLRGANIVRTHDVRETREMILGMEAVLNASA